MEFSNTSTANNQTTITGLTERKLDELYLENCNISLIENKKLGNSLTTFPSNTGTSDTSQAWQITKPATQRKTSKSGPTISHSSDDSEVTTTSLPLTTKSISTSIERKYLSKYFRWLKTLWNIPNGTFNTHYLSLDICVVLRKRFCLIIQIGYFNEAR